MKIQHYTQWVIACPVWYKPRNGVTHYTNDETIAHSRRSAIEKLHKFYADWSDNAPEKFWTWKQFYARGYRAVKVMQVLA